jgi:hypothetical protein
VLLRDSVSLTGMARQVIVQRCFEIEYLMVVSTNLCAMVWSDRNNWLMCCHRERPQTYLDIFGEMDVTKPLRGQWMEIDYHLQMPLFRIAGSYRRMYWLSVLDFVVPSRAIAKPLVPVPAAEEPTATVEQNDMQAV